MNKNTGRPRVNFNCSITDCKNLAKAKGLCVKHYYVKRCQEHPEEYRNNWLMDKYNQTLDQYDGMFKKQKGCCKICGNTEIVVDKRTGEPKPLCVDHDHNCCPGEKSCGECIRGLICCRCNVGLGYFLDSIETLQNAVDYLINYKNRHSSLRRKNKSLRIRNR